MLAIIFVLQKMPSDKWNCMNQWQRSASSLPRRQKRQSQLPQPKGWSLQKEQTLVYSLGTTNSIRVRRSDNRRVQGSLTDYLRPIGVGMCLVSTLLTLEVAASLPVGFGRMAADGTLLAGVEGGHKLDSHARQFGLVFQFVRHVSERPGMQVSPMLFANRYAASDMRQFFQRKSSAAVFGFGDYFFTDTVVDIFGEAGLFATAFLQEPLGGFCAFALEAATDTAITPPQTVDLPATEQFAVAGCGEYDKAEINANVFRYGWTLCFRDGDTDEQVELSVAQNKIRLTAWEPEQLPLPVAANETDHLPAIDRPYRNGVLFAFPRENASIKGNASKRLELPFNLMVKLVSLGNLGDTSDNHLRRERREVTPGGMVDSFMLFVLAENFTLESDNRELATDAVCLCDGVPQGYRLFLAWSQLNLSNQLHGSRLLSRLETVNNKQRRPKGRGFNPKEF
jgi:hypothetical protein